jgi:hypothetical protein
MTKFRKELKFIEAKSIRNTMKDILANAQKAHRLGVTFFCK